MSNSHLKLYLAQPKMATSNTSGKNSSLNQVFPSLKKKKNLFHHICWETRNYSLLLLFYSTYHVSPNESYQLFLQTFLKLASSFKSPLYPNTRLNSLLPLPKSKSTLLHMFMFHLSSKRPANKLHRRVNQIMPSICSKQSQDAPSELGKHLNPWSWYRKLSIW